MLMSIVIPVYNEAGNIKKVFEAINKVIVNNKLYENLDFEFVFIDDGSKDSSFLAIEQLIEQNSESNLDQNLTRDYKYITKIEGIAFSRNFGKEAAIYAGLKHSKGDALIVIDSDLQHPPELIVEFISYWQQGYDMVYGVLKNRKHQGFVTKILSSAFYKVTNKLSSIEIPNNAGDYRLMTRKVADALLCCDEKNQFMKGLYAWVGFKSKALPFEAQQRKSGKSSWGIYKLLRLAKNGLTSFSNAPLRLAMISGVVISFVSFLYGLWIILEVMLYGVTTPGFATIMCVMLFLGGIQLVALGIVGEYIANIFNEVKNRPLYLISKKASYKLNK